MWFFTVLFDLFSAEPILGIGFFVLLFLFFEKLWFLRERPADMSVFQYMISSCSRKFF